MTPGSPLTSLGTVLPVTLGSPLRLLGDSAACDTGVAPQIPGGQRCL